MRMMYRAIDIFCGCGGLSTGAVRAGINVIAGVDVCEPELQTFRKSHAESIPLLLDIISDPGAVDSLAGLCRALGVNAIIGGPPCQDFSGAGKREGKDGKRNGFPAAIRLIEKLRPELVLFENVPGFVAGPSREYALNVFREIRELGYAVAHRELGAADYGVPQDRKRIFIIALRGHDSIRDNIWPCPTHDKYGRYGLLKWRGWGEIVDTSRPIDRPATSIVKKHVTRYLDKIREDADDPRQMSLLVQQIGGGTDGEAFRCRESELPSPTVLCGGDRGRADLVMVQNAGGFDGKSLRITKLSAPSPTIATGGGNGSGGVPVIVRLDGEGSAGGGPTCFDSKSPAPTIGASDPKHLLVSGKDGSDTFSPPVATPSQPAQTVNTAHDRTLLCDVDSLMQRHLHYRELAALQSFPDDYPFQGNLTVKRRQIGNAVPPELSYHIFRSTLEKLK